MNIIVMGSIWSIVKLSAQEDELLSDCDGYTDWTTKRIVIDKEMNGNLGDMQSYVNKVIRHEIIHAFLLECGLAGCTCGVGAWAQNEEMVDWFSRIGQKIFCAWEEAGVL